MSTAPLALLPLAAAASVPPYAGLQNQGNTCYMNSLLQSLSHVPGFARTLYELPPAGTEGGSPTASVPPGAKECQEAEEAAQVAAVAFEMQRLLYQLGRAPALGKVYVGTQRFTRSLGMSPRDVLVQQDAQEFWQRLYGSLAAVGREPRRKGEPPPPQTRLGALFQGTTLNYVRCTKVPFRSERQGRFCDLQLQVSGCKSLEASLRRFTAEETLDGEYNTRDSRYGRQPPGTVRRGCAFLSLPPVLMLHLKRFEYDMTTGEMRKLEDRFSFPTTLKLRRFMAKGSLNKGDPAPVYELRAVLTHQGGVGAGHYYSFVKPVGSRGAWYKFDDARVTLVSEEAAVAQQFGGSSSASRSGGGLFGLGNGAPVPCAYMLAYVRQSDAQLAEEAAAARSDDLDSTGVVLGGAPAIDSDHLSDDVREAFEAEIKARTARRKK